MAPEVVVARGLPPCIEVGAVPVYAELSGQDGGGVIDTSRTPNCSHQILRLLSASWQGGRRH